MRGAGTFGHGCGGVIGNAAAGFDLRVGFAGAAGIDVLLVERVSLRRGERDGNQRN
jgi:hypothetical protein